MGRCGSYRLGIRHIRLKDVNPIVFTILPYQFFKFLMRRVITIVFDNGATKESQGLIQITFYLVNRLQLVGKPLLESASGNSGIMGN